MSSCLILTERNRYFSCHIQLPDEAKPIPAIAVADCFYGYFKFVRTATEVLKLIGRLSSRHNQLAITNLATATQGYGIWVLEPQAIDMRPEQSQLQQAKTQLAPAAFKYFSLEQECQLIDIRVPDLYETIPAIADGGKYYSLFKIEEDEVEVLLLAAKLTGRGDEVAIAQLEQGYAVCVLELEANPVSS
ncbi:hypothetical protein Pse7367_3851 (plasmid) [Thalassoporum mexicanum PCC 7367]|uniref:hypothetical protein n=1 Tax=Thalassoporum mexicanum TaxID=3457544 RepID=UPI00029FD74C|nr:hypothetical protein [Pseudanabaena sp. PCC 7367]AFY72074.1 hypothetical protein Pse7367_3851 [Pseudanabaena sp. PCC 7367]